MIGGTSFDRSDPKGASKMSDDERPAEVQKLESFVGEWEVKGFLTAGDETSAITGLWKFEETVDGWGIKVTSETAIEGMGEFSEAELIGFDPAEEKMHMFSLNRFAARDHIGSWEADNTFSVRYAAEVDGTQVMEHINIRLVDADHMVARVEEFNDTVLAITTDLTLVRQERADWGAAEV